MFTSSHNQLDELVVSGRSRPELELGIGELSRLEAHVVERRLAFTAAIDSLNDGGVSGADINRSRGRRSKKASRQAAETAEKLTEMPRVRAALARGEINQEHADAAAAAATRTSSETADNELSGLAKAQPADMFAKKARDWAAAKESLAAVAKRYERQRRLRECSTWTDGDGMLCLYARLDPVAGKELTSQLDEAVDQLWRADGGRDGTPDDIPSAEQRRADALTQLATTPNEPSKRPHPKYTIMLAVDTSRLRADNPRDEAKIIDGEALPQQILEQIACNSAFAGAIYAADGAVLWQSRTKRLATDDQWNQLIIRDRGCVICAPSPSHREAHHIIPHAPPTNGSTNIDNLVLICPSDHHLAHSDSHQLVQTEQGWQLQPRHRKPNRKDRAA